MAGRYRLIAHECLGSTNEEALALLRAGDPGGVIVTAARQSAGRGRHGRSWASPHGNLYATLALRDPAPVAQAPQLGFVAGVALAATLRARLGGDRRLQLKWPNDALFAGAKLAGILLESTTLADGGFGCAVGIGVNCVSSPAGLPYPATDLAAAGAPAVSADALVAELADSLHRILALWDRGKNFAAIRERWLEVAAGRGEPIVVRTPRGALEGTFRDIDASGRLLLDAATGLVAIEAGDVFFCVPEAERVA